MNEPQSFQFNGHEVFNLDDLILYDQAYFYGCLKRKRDVLIKKPIKADDYFYAKITENVWEESDESYSRAKILVKVRWAKTNVTKLKETPTTTELREAPPLLELEEHEKFRDEDDNVYEVEVRGVREEDKIYFKGKDVERIFKMENLISNISLENFKYIEDYEKFLVTGEKRFKKQTFFTINGMKKIICRSRSISPYKLKCFLDNPFIKKLGITMDIIHLYKEQETINIIIDVFIGYETIKQFSVGKYRIDLYFPEYLLAVECDEFNHSHRDQDYEYNREKYIKKRLKCTFIRFNPDERDFKIGFVLKLIFDHIHERTCLEGHKLLLQEKDNRIFERNREIDGYKEREQEWREKEVKWRQEREWGQERKWKEKEADWSQERSEWNQERSEWKEKEADWSQERSEWNQERSEWKEKEADWSQERSEWKEKETEWNQERTRLVKIIEKLTLH